MEIHSLMSAQVAQLRETLQNEPILERLRFI